MTWAFLDDRVHENPKQVSIGGAAAWYWAMGLTYCRRLEAQRVARGERPDFIPAAAALVLFADAKAKKHVAAIVRVGLWEPVEGGYVVHDYERVYGRQPTPLVEVPPAGDQPTPSQLGGLARAAGASRGPAGTFQRRQPAGPAEHQPAGPAKPASRASGSGSGSDSGSDLSVKAAAKELSGSRASEGEPAAAASVQLDEHGRFRMHVGWTPSEASKQAALMIVAKDHALTWFTGEFIGHFAASDEVDDEKGWQQRWSKWVSRGWNSGKRPPDPNAPPQDPRGGPRRAGGGPAQEWPTDEDLRLREAIRSGHHGEVLKRKLELGQLDHESAKKELRNARDEAKDKEQRHRDRRATGPVPVGDLLPRPKTGAA
jgi:hypothetical protein